MRKSFLVGITTNYGKKQLVNTLKSLRKSVGVGKFRILVIADDVKLSRDIKASLHKLDVEFVENDFLSSAWSKAKQMIGHCKEEIILFTQDDLLFEKDAIKKVISVFENDSKATYVCLKNEPMGSTNWVQRGINSGTRIVNSIAISWRGGDNYYSAFGRVMAFPTKWLLNMNIDPDPVSVDAYLYFDNKIKGGKFVNVWDSALYFINPTNLTEHLQKSSRFQHSKDEMERYFDKNFLEEEYQIDNLAMIKAIIKEAFGHPVDFLYAIAVFSYSRFFKIRQNISLDPVWKPEISTKML